MRVLRVGLGVVALALVAMGCNSGASRDTSSAGVCSWPAAANTFDAATSLGCEPQPTFQICGVPSGATLDPDGTYTPPATCSDPCAPEAYPLRCTGSIVDGVVTTMPEPAPSLACQVLPLPMPLGTAVYCCACARGG